MKFEIKNRFTGKLIFECDADSWKIAIELAIKSNADLTEANLTRADLTEANLTEANLTRADLTEANLTGANLTEANLTEANLTRADLTEANLTGADLTEANLTGANLTRADLTEANLTVIRDDLWAVLSAAPKEVGGLRQALIDGKVDGSTYSGECACLVGTIAHVKGVDYKKMDILKPNCSRPSERFFLGIKKGDTPENNQHSKIALEWIDIWLENMRSAFAKGE